MASTAALYSPEVLALATSLAAIPLDDALPLRATARSRSCGSVVELGLETGPDGRVARIGVKAQACAIGQASAALFAQGAIGLTGTDIARAELELRTWLSDGGALPDWPGLAAIAAARAYPGRHGAILLAWQAARELLPSG